MKKLGLSLLIFTMACSNGTSNAEVVEVSENESNSNTVMAEGKSIYDGNFKVKTIDGNDFDLSSLKGTRVMIVNTASFCGYTPQYESLQELYAEYKDAGFTIIGFPANNFGAQEPHDNATIKEFCSANYGVEFQMMEKISVSGSDMHPLYQWLTSKDMNGVADAPVKWNFQKFLIDEEGHLVEVLGSGVSPLDDKVINFAKG